MNSNREWTPDEHDRPLPAALDIERLTLGSLMAEADSDRFADAQCLLSAEDFSLEKHRLIFRAMVNLHAAGQAIDRVSVATHLQRLRQLEAVDGLSYLAALDSDMPHVAKLDSWIRVLNEKALLRRTVLSLTAIVNRAHLETDPSEELLEDARRCVVALGEGIRRQLGLQTVEQIIEQAGGINEFISPRKTTGVPWLFSEIEDTTASLREGQLVVLGARPSIGKSAFAMQQAVASAAAGTCTAVFSLEMASLEILHRQVANMARISAMKWRRGELNQFERLALADSISELVAFENRLLISEQRRLTLESMGAELRQLRSRDKQIGLVVIDYLQLMRPSGRYDNREQEVSSISRGLKLLAGEFKAPVLALVQLSRKTEERRGKRPELSDLRESGSLEQDADTVLFLWPANENERAEEEVRTINWRCAKQRSGPLNEGSLYFVRKYVRFEGTPYKAAAVLNAALSSERGVA